MDKREEEPDITLRLLASQGPDPPPLLRLHSGVLVQRSAFFASLLSERWRCSKNNKKKKTPLEEEEKEEEADKEEEEDVIRISVPPSRSPDTYQRCIHLMYVPRHALLSGISAGALFGSVQEAFDMLEVAAEFLFRDCEDACQAFIERRLSWTPEEESALRACLSSLQLSAVNADLAARLRLQRPKAAMAAQRSAGADPGWAMQVQRDTLSDVLCRAYREAPSIGSGFSTTRFHGADLVIRPVLVIPAGRPIPRSAILQAWNANLDVLKAALQPDRKGFFRLYPEAEKKGFEFSCSPQVESFSLPRSLTSEIRLSPTVNDAATKDAFSMLDWLLCRLLDLRVAHVVVEAFAIDTRFSELVKDFLLNRETKWPPGSIDVFFSCSSLTLVHRLIGLVHNGQVLLPQSVRVSLIRTWMPTFQQLRDPPGGFEKPFCDMILSLPLTQQGEFFHDWITGSKPWPDLSTLFGPYCETLREAPLQHGPSQVASLISDD